VHCGEGYCAISASTASNNVELALVLPLPEPDLNLFPLFGRNLIGPGLLRNGGRCN